MIVSPILIGLASASFNISVLDSGVAITTNLDLEVLARSCIYCKVPFCYSCADLFVNFFNSHTLYFFSYKFNLFSKALVKTAWPSLLNASDR